MYKRLLTFLSDSFVYGLSGVFAQLVNFLLLPIYTRFLTLEDYGTLALLAILSAVFIPVAGMGLSPAIFRFYREPDVDNNNLLSTGVFTVSLSAILLLAITLYFADSIENILLSANTKESVLLVQITLVSAALMSISTMFLTSLRANRRPVATVVITGISLLFQISISIILVVYFEMKVLGVTIGIFSGGVISLFLLFMISRNTIHFVIKKNLLLKMLSYGIYSVPTQIISLLNLRASLYIIKNLINTTSVGLYSIASRFMLPITLVGSSIQYAHPAFFFHVLKEDENPEDVLRSIATYFVVGISILWVFASIWGPEILRLMTTPSFHEAYVYIGPLGLIPVLLLLYTFLASGIDSGKDLRPYMLVNITGLFVLISASLVLIKHFGIFGAISGAILSRVVMILVAVRFALNRLRIKYNYFLILLIIILAGTFSIIPNYIDKFTLYTRLLINAALMFSFPVLCVITMSMYKTERAQLISFALRIKRKIALV